MTAKDAIPSKIIRPNGSIHARMARMDRVIKDGTE